ncbi:hypothetical protein ACLOJK_004667 [Asimina triloba]
MPDVQVWMSIGSGDYGYESGYTPVLVGWETSIEPKCSEEDPDFDWDTEEVNRNIVMIDPLLWFRPSASSSDHLKTLVGFGILELVVHGKNRVTLKA